MENEEMNDSMEDAAEKGRGTDSVLAHMSLGEIVIPRAFQDDPQVMEILKQIFQSNGADINEFTVGHEANKINPETGNPEFFFKSFKKLFKVAAPLALSYFAPGIGTALGSALGAGAAWAPIVGGAALGAGTSALTGGNAIQGAALGGIGGGISSAAGGNFDNTALGRTVSGAYNDIGDELGGVFGKAASRMQGPTMSGASLGEGSGIAGALTKPFVDTAPQIAAGGGAGSSYSGIGGKLMGGLGSALNQSQAQDDLLEQQRNAMAAYQPFMNAQFTGVDLENDPGYKSRLAEGEKALARKQSASGSLFSGAALKEAQDYGQGLADQTQQDAYNRWLQTQRLGLTAAGGVADTYSNIGNINAAGTAGISNTFADALSRSLNLAPEGYEYDQNGNLVKKRA